MDEYADFGPLDSVDIVPTENTQPRTYWLDKGSVISSLSSYIT